MADESRRGLLSVAGVTLSCSCAALSAGTHTSPLSILGAPHDGAQLPQFRIPVRTAKAERRDGVSPFAFPAGVGVVSAELAAPASRQPIVAAPSGGVTEAGKAGSAIADVAGARFRAGGSCAGLVMLDCLGKRMLRWSGHF